MEVKMSASLYWLPDDVWATIEPHLPHNQPGAKRTDDRRIISGIVHMLKCGARWQDVPPAYGPPTTVYNRWHRWSGRGIWRKMLEVIAERAAIHELGYLDSSYIKAHRSAQGGKGGPGRRRLVSLGAVRQRKSMPFATSLDDRSRLRSRPATDQTFALPKG
jgi:transposase